MYRTLGDLKTAIENLIEQQSPDSPVAAFIFTKEDVFYYTKEDEYFEEEHHLDSDDTNTVLENVGDSDYVYGQVAEMIEDEVKRIIGVVESDD